MEDQSVGKRPIHQKEPPHHQPLDSPQDIDKPIPTFKNEPRITMGEIKSVAAIPSDGAYHGETYPIEPPSEPPVQPPPEATPPIPKPPIASMPIALKILLFIAVVGLTVSISYYSLWLPIASLTTASKDGCSQGPPGYVNCGLCDGRCHWCPQGTTCSPNRCDCWDADLIAKRQQLYGDQLYYVPSSQSSNNQQVNQPVSTGSITGVYKGEGKMFEWFNKDKVHPQIGEGSRPMYMVANLKQSGNTISGTMQYQIYQVNKDASGYDLKTYTDQVSGTVIDTGGKKKVTLTELNPSNGACSADTWEFDISDTNTWSGSYFNYGCPTYVSNGLQLTPIGWYSYPNSFVLKRQ